MIQIKLINASMWSEARRRADSACRRTLDLSGEWHAIWQTTAEGRPNINTELVVFTQQGDRLVLENLGVSPENPRGGYLWVGEAVLHDNQYVVGSYAATGARVGARGTLYFVVDRRGDYLVGHWAGCNADSNLSWGFGVFAKDKGVAADKLELFMSVGTRGVDAGSFDAGGFDAGFRRPSHGSQKAHGEGEEYVYTV